MSALPNFLIVGTAKSGTNTLVRLLSNHPDIFFPIAAEPNFFAFDKEYEKGIDYYKSKFSGGENKAARGEKSWRYSVKEVYPSAIPRIRKHLDLDKLRIIYLVREPLTRLESLWIEFRSSGQDRVTNNFNRALQQNQILIESSLYWKQICAYRKFIPDERIKVLFFEELIKKPNEIIKSVLEFLGLNGQTILIRQDTHENKSNGKLADTKIMELLRLTPGFGYLRDLAPQAVRKDLRQLFKRPIYSRPIWDPEVRAKTINQIREDAENLLIWCNKDNSFWNLN